MSTWKEAISLTLPTEAHMIQGYLASEGIETMLKDELTAQVNNFYSNAVGGVKVMVREEEYEAALQVLEKGGYLQREHPQQVEVVNGTNSTNTKQCPFCHSENIGKEKSPDFFMLVISLLFGGIFPIFRRPDTCFDCGKKWVFKGKRIE